MPKWLSVCLCFLAIGISGYHISHTLYEREVQRETRIAQLEVYVVALEDYATVLEYNLYRTEGYLLQLQEHMNANGLPIPDPDPMLWPIPTTNEGVVNAKY